MTNEILTEHFLHLHTETRVTAEALADSLIGLEGVIRRSGDILKGLLGEEGRIRTEVFINSIEIASYKENFMVRLLFGRGRVMEENIEKLRRALHLDKLSPKRIVALAVGALVLYVAWKTLKPGDAAASHIEDAFNRYGQQLGMSGEELKALIEAKTASQADLRRSVVKLLHPRGDPRTGVLSIDGDQHLSIPAQVVSVVPLHFDATDEDEPFDDRDNCQIVVRALDLDRAHLGWHAIALDISDRRLPLRIASGIDTTKIPVGEYIQADITVVYKVDRDGNKTPKRYELRKWRRNLVLSGEPEPPKSKFGLPKPRLLP